MTEKQADADRRFGPRAAAVIREWTGAHPAEDRDPSVAEVELDYWMARAYEAEGKLWKAEARIKAVQDVLDNPIHLADWDDPLVPATHIRRALDGA